MILYSLFFKTIKCVGDNKLCTIQILKQNSLRSYFVRTVLYPKRIFNLITCIYGWINNQLIKDFLLSIILNINALELVECSFSLLKHKTESATLVATIEMVE